MTKQEIIDRLKATYDGIIEDEKSGNNEYGVYTADYQLARLKECVRGILVNDEIEKREVQNVRDN